MKQLPTYSLLLKVKQVVAIAFLLGKIISLNVWMTDRTFPVLPFFDFLHTVPSFIHTALFVVSLLLLGINSIRPSQNNWLIISLVVEICSILLDETRLQAWVYEYLLLLFPFVFLKEGRNEEYISTALKWILIATYFWSGFYKCNNGFLYTVWKPIVGMSVASSWLKSGYIIPCVEMLLAIGLIFTKTRKTAALGLMMMHVFILIVFGPLGMNYNVSVWLWNVCMILLLGLLFFMEEGQSSLPLPKLYWQYAVLIFCIAPVGNVFGVWKNEMSFKLYSGDAVFLYACLPEDAWRNVPDDLRNGGKSVSFCEGKMLSTKTWAMEEMNVMPCSNERYLQSLRAALSSDRFKGYDIHFWIHESPYDSASIHEWK